MNATPEHPRPDPDRSNPSRVTRLRQRWRQAGVRQINQALAELLLQLEHPDLSAIDRAVLQGRVRELRTARWLVNQILATPGTVKRTGESSAAERWEDWSGSRSESSRVEPPRQGGAIDRDSGDRIGNTGRPLAAFPTSIGVSAPSAIQVVEQQANSLTPPLSSSQLQDLIFERVSRGLQGSLENLTDAPLEIDILRQEKKQELVYLTLRKIEDLLSELRYSQIESGLLGEQRSRLLQDLWASIMVDFFGKYYAVSLGDTDFLVVDRLLREVDFVRIEILDRIPAVIELLRHVLYLEPLVVDSYAYAAGNPEALTRSILILENWLLQMANAVMQPLLNRFANVEPIKHQFYDRRLLSSREIERFRNDLSWRYRLLRLVQEPKNMFESQYQLLSLSDRGIRQTAIYAPRTAELEQLSGWQYAVTLALETRDAIAPRLRSIVSFVGNGFVYVLTDVVGRGIGLIGRGVLKGIGNAWQDSRFSRK